MDKNGNIEPLGLKKPITKDWCCKLLAFLYVFGEEGGMKEFIEGCVPFNNDILSAQAAMKKNTLGINGGVYNNEYLRSIVKEVEERVGELARYGLKVTWLKDIEAKYKVVLIDKLKLN